MRIQNPIKLIMTRKRLIIYLSTLLLFSLVNQQVIRQKCNPVKYQSTSWGKYKRGDNVLKHAPKNIKIDKSPSPDNLYHRLQLELKETISKPLCILFIYFQILVITINIIIPRNWKYAQISAIFHTGNKTQAKKYRPVSLTSMICKTMQVIIKQHIIDHMKLQFFFKQAIWG